MHLVPFRLEKSLGVKPQQYAMHCNAISEEIRLELQPRFIGRKEDKGELSPYCESTLCALDPLCVQANIVVQHYLQAGISFICFLPCLNPLCALWSQDNSFQCHIVQMTSSHCHHTVKK